MKIESYNFGKMVIDGKSFNNDLIILPNKEIKDNWWRKEGHLLQLEDLKEVINHSPEILIVGQGAYGSMKISLEVKNFLSSKNIKLIHQNTKEVYKKFNKYSQQKKKIAGAFHLTC